MLTALVTGANTGMGLATTVELATQGYQVIMLCRNKGKGESALRQAKKESKSKNIELMIADLGDLASIRSFAEQFKRRYDTLDLLINNAGIVTLKRQETKDGFELMMGVNHLGHFLLTHLLLEEIKQAPQGRIVVVSSGAHTWGKIDFDNMHLHKGFNVIRGYGQSKLANVLFMRALAKRLENTSVTVNALHPGAVSTQLGIDRKSGFGKSIIRLLKPFFKTPAEGSDTALYLGTSPEAAKFNGGYFVNRKQVPFSKVAEDEELCEQFWKWSENETNSQEKERGV